MFGRLDDIIENVKGLDVNQALAFSISKPNIQFFILELNRRRQLFFQGIDAEGKLLSSIGGNYTLFTLQQKQGTRPVNAANLINLFDTGDFYDSFRIILQEDGFLIEANTIKEGTDLQDRWGDELLGLTDDSREVLIEKIQPDIVEYLKGAILA